jgi:hypothetical protein
MHRKFKQMIVSKIYLAVYLGILKSPLAKKTAHSSL